jgi:flagellar hook-basal body complex protein FliE
MVSGIGALMNAVATAPVTNTPQVGAAGVTDAAGMAGQAGQAGDSFGNVVTNALQGMQDSQNSANSLAVQAATGDLTDVHNYTIAATEASLQTEMTVAVRDRAVAAFNQIMSMQI